MTELPADKNTILAYVLEKYGTAPDHPWPKYPDYLVLRHSSSRKWYAVIMRLPLYKLGVDINTPVDIINIKCEPELIGSLRQKQGYFPAYHMNKEHWLTLLLDKSLPMQEVCDLINMSYGLTKT